MGGGGNMSCDFRVVSIVGIVSVCCDFSDGGMTYLHAFVCLVVRCCVYVRGSNYFIATLKCCS